MIHLTVTDSGVGVRLDAFIAENSELSRAMAQKLIDNGSVTVNGKAEDKKYKLCPGDKISIDPPEPKPCVAMPEDIPLDVIYEDDDVIVINKPKGIVVHPAAGNETGTLVNALIAHCGDSLSGIGGVMRPGIVHRIDKDTSGLLVVAKNDAAHIFLSDEMKDHSVSRIYYAIARGYIDEPLTVDLPIGRHPVDRKKMAVTYKNSKNAITHIEPIERLDGATYIKCRLETGRTHQIRVHLSHIGHPIIGDEIYGGTKNPVMQKFGKGLVGQCLHAAELTFVHPRTKEPMHFTSPLPDYFSRILELMRGQNG
ncbi:MAG: RluA family pseudouridine synthase [Clostridia bacterium]|nr:RluA family pseudouridine synthase [Clostridia bacterium]